MAERIGITTTIPSEVIFASGAVPVDLNNIFITAAKRGEYIKAAERDGYPRNVCAWIKGIYGVLSRESDIKTVVAVTQGDCSNTHALMETLRLIGIRTIPFAYPYNRDQETLSREINTLATTLKTDMDTIENTRIKCEPVRTQLDRLDTMSWKDNLISGAENHLWLVSSSDFNGDIDTFSRDLGAFLAEAENRTPDDCPVRLAYLGVPPILDNFHDTIESLGARVVFNEVQRQFSMPVRNKGIVDQYLAYTYPYSVYHRLEYIVPELKRRNINGVIHYVQSFCHRQIEDLVIRKMIDLPVLTIEGESPGNVDERTKIRLQAFIEMLV